ncbi:peptidase [Bacillus cytotoxicus]|nr:peptidase [Bacillus cytotoxicus]NZD35031.1 peptidase [Bacillus cytotoxicus]
MLNSDGYKILITIFNIEELENKRKNHILVKLIQVIGVILAIRSVMLWFV